MSSIAAATLLALSLTSFAQEAAPPAVPPPAAPQESTPARPDVVLVVIDTLRPDHLELYGYAKPTSPFLKELGARAAVFERAYSSSSWTAPATASVMTGLYPTGHGVVDGKFAHERAGRRGANAAEPAAENSPAPEKLVLNAIPDRIDTVAERFRAAGYVTIGRAANINVDAVMGFAQGFDHFECKSQANADALSDGLLAPDSPLKQEKPTFLYLHFNDAHEPYAARRPWYKPERDPASDRKARYDSEIRAIDEQLRKLHDALGWSRDTILVIVSDHGEEFQEHGRTGHRFSLHYELNHVAMLAAGPGIEPRRIGVTASLVDVLPTLCELAGLEAGAGGLDGISLAPLLRSADAAAPAAVAERTLFAHRGDRSQKPAQHLWAAQSDRYRMIQLGPRKLPLFYDVAADPLEAHDLAAEAADSPDLRGPFEALRAALDRFRARGIPPPEATGEITIDDATYEELKKLGYTGGGDPEKGDK
jgi:arylsulfatase A-like enzyme